MREIKGKIYESIKNDIITCKYKPGEILEERMLTERYGVSRTPIREVLSMLKQEGWIVERGKKGICIPDITLKEVKDLFQIRYEVEPMVLKFSFQKLSKERLKKLKASLEKSLEAEEMEKLVQLDDKLHCEILRGSQNELAISIFEKIHDQTRRFRYLTHTDREETLKSAKEHIKLLDSILDEDLEGSVKILKKHIDNNQLHFIRNIQC